jgi:hypothetical protein
MSGAIIKIKRRAAINAAGAPASLNSGELAFNENATDKNLYYGYGDDGSGNATSVVAIAGEGSFTTLSTNQTITGSKIFTGTVTLTGATVSLSTDQLTEGTARFLSASGVRAQVAGGTNIDYNESTGTFALASQVAVVSGLSVGGGVTIGGDLIVSGTTTTINSTTVSVADKNIELGLVDSPSDITADGGGITLKGATDKTIIWASGTTCWTFNQPIDAPSIRVGGVEIVDSSRVLSNVTLSGVVIDGGEF